MVIAGCGGSDLSVCPNHQPCVHFVANPAIGGNGATDGGDADLALRVPYDLGSAHAPDLSAPPSDLTVAAPDLLPACVATGGSCATHDDAVCCSHYCVYATNTCR
jgi:hypothetical protein